MGNFSTITKYLDFIRSRRATQAEASEATVPFDKYYRFTRARKIRKIPYTLTLPAYTTVTDFISPIYYRRLAFQYNVTVGFNFYIVTPIVNDIFFSAAKKICKFGYLTVKWRVGTDVFRYRIRGEESLELNNNVLSAHEAYNNQLVPSNCVFEFWRLQGFNQPCGLLQDFKIEFGRLRNPNSGDELDVNTDADAPLTIAQLGVALPENLPYNQANIVWLDN